ncbi:hypothetical protein TREMEDRAFT_55968, partial [Tremella mesenterica DSM 1558]
MFLPILVLLPLLLSTTGAPAPAAEAYNPFYPPTIDQPQLDSRAALEAAGRAAIPAHRGRSLLFGPKHGLTKIMRSPLLRKAQVKGKQGIKRQVRRRKFCVVGPTSTGSANATLISSSLDMSSSTGMTTSVGMT